MHRIPNEGERLLIHLVANDEIFHGISANTLSVVVAQCEPRWAQDFMVVKTMLK